MLATIWRVALAAGLFWIGWDMAHAQHAAPPVAIAPAAALYQEHCAACHGAQRLGGMGPALLPESLARLRRPDAAKVITQGRVATQMQGFADKLDATQIAAITDWIYSPVTPAPSWSDADIRASASRPPVRAACPPGRAGAPTR